MPDTSSDLVDRWRSVVHQQHDERVADILARLSAREQGLVREAAVMGFVQGRMDAGVFSGQMPKDSEILYRTLDGVGGFPDTFPVLSGWSEGQRHE